jgi:hypothetical protein
MPKSLIRNPYKHIDRDDLVNVQAAVPRRLYYLLFSKMFPARGSMNNIGASLFNIFALACQKCNIPEDFDPNNEKVVNKILIQIQHYVENELEP